MSEGRDEDEEYGKFVCLGCGIFMQDSDFDLFGYYQKRKVVVKSLEEVIEDEFDGFEMVDDDDDEEEDDDIMNVLESSDFESEEDEFDWELDEWEEKEEGNDVELDGFVLVGVGYGNVIEEMVEKKCVSKFERKKLVREEVKKDKDDDDVIVCVCCYFLRNYG